jgi:biopolymer transport protein ExbD
VEFRRRLKPVSTVDLVPMIDVVFQLIIYFMVSTTFILTPGIGIVLPESSTAEPVAMTKIVITVADEDAVYLNRDRYDLAGPDLALSKITKDDREQIRTVIVEGDSSVPYTLLVDVLDILRRNGFSGINLRMREEASP